jgi:hypothetical protein
MWIVLTLPRSHRVMGRRVSCTGFVRTCTTPPPSGKNPLSFAHNHRATVTQPSVSQLVANNSSVVCVCVCVRACVVCVCVCV